MKSFSKFGIPHILFTSCILSFLLTAYLLPFPEHLLPLHLRFHFPLVLNPKTVPKLLFYTRKLFFQSRWNFGKYFETYI